MVDQFKHLENLVLEMGASLSREMGELRSDMNAGFYRIDSATKKQGGMIVSGAVAIATLTKTVNRLEAQMANRDKELRDVKARLRKVEQRKNGGRVKF